MTSASLPDVAHSACAPLRRSIEPAICARAVRPAQHLRHRNGCCSAYVHANAQRGNVEMKGRPDNLVGGGDNPDWLGGKALHVRLDRTAVHGHAQETERPVLVRDFGSRGALGLTRQYDSSALTGKCASIGGRQGHGSNNRGARTDSRNRRPSSERDQCPRDHYATDWSHLNPTVMPLPIVIATPPERRAAPAARRPSRGARCGYQRCSGSDARSAHSRTPGDR
jgi:hypothetical protein